MPLWGTSEDAATNKPKWLPDDANSPYDKTKVFASQSGWVQRAGTAASGNDNTSAQEEVLVAIGGLAGASATTGLHHPTLTNFRVISKVDPDVTHIDGTSLSNGLTGNVLRFTATSGAAATFSLADDVTMSNRTSLTDNVTTTAIEAAQTTLTSAIKSAIGVTTIVIA